jgi:hypothetical protein
MEYYLDGVTYYKWREIQAWCHENCSGKVKFDYQDWGEYMDVKWVFDNEKDAALFALRWL